MKYSTIPVENRPPLNGHEYWLWRVMRARVEELPWIARRIVKANHLTKGYYDTPELWLANIDRAQTVAKNIRGQEYSPAIFVHGIMPRCGSNIIHDILEVQPTVIGRGIGISEFPILCSSRAMDAFYASVVSRHREVAENISGMEFMSFLVSGWLRDIQLRIDEGNSALLKMPSVQHLDLFHGLFPRDKLVIVIRDGRDIVQSTLDTWKGARQFLKSDIALAREYAASAEVISEYLSQAAHRVDDNVYLFRYEDYISNPYDSVRKLFNFLGLSTEDSLVRAAVNLPVRGASSIKQDGHTTWDPVAKPKDFSSSAKWHTWGKRRRKRFAKAANKALVNLGYESSDEWVQIKNVGGG